jgi:hypothetical protein
MGAATVTPEPFDEEPERFKFVEPGDRLVGTLVHVAIVKSSYGPQRYPLLEVRADDGRLYEVHASAAALVSQFRREQPQPGERIKIEFRGTATSNTGRSYKDFGLRVARTKHAPVDYGELDDVNDPDDDDTLL